MLRDHDGAPSSLLTGLTRDATPRPAIDARVAGELEEMLARHLVEHRPVADAAQVVLALGVGGLVLDAVPWSRLTVWVLVLLAVTVARARIGTRLRTGHETPGRTRLVFRLAVVVVALAWGIGATILVPHLALDRQAILVVAYSALIAASTMSLVADPVSFYLFVGTLLGGMSFATLVGRQSLPGELLLFLALGCVFLLPLFRRSHVTLSKYLLMARGFPQGTAGVTERSFLDAVFASAPCAIVAVTNGGKVLGANSGFERLFGHSADQILGQDLDSLIVPIAGRAEAAALEDQVRRGHLVTAKAERLRRDGESISVIVSAAPVEGFGFGGMCIVYDDVTDMKQAQRALRRAKEEYRQLVETSSDLVWKLDRDLRFSFLNAACNDLYSASPDELLGTRLEDRLPPDRREQDMAAFRAVLAGSELADYQTAHLDAHGTRRHLNFGARPTRDRSGTIVGAQGMARDVSSIVHAVEALEEARSAAVQAADAKTAFLATMSHEIRTPMNGVLGMTELLLGTDLDQEQRRAAELVRLSAGSLLSLINDVLDLSKIEAGRLSLEETSFDPSTLVDSVVRMAAVQAFENGVEVAYDIRPNVPQYVFGDPGRFRQVLSNLVGNALKFTHEGEVVVTLSAEVEDGDALMLRAVVRDSGVGIPPDRLELVFDEYTQSDASTARTYGGTGLGLPISRRLVELMGGEIHAESQLGTGSSFSFTVRVRRDHRPVEDATRHRVTVDGATALVVGSNTASRGIVADILRGAGVVASEAGDAGSAVTQLEHAPVPYALAVIDSYLPGKDGFHLAELVQCRKDLRRTKVMILTSAGQRGDGQRCRELGVAAYLTKPVSRPEFLEAVATVLGETTGRVVEPQLVTKHSIEETRQRLRVLLAEDNPVNQTVAATMLRRRGHVVDVVDDGAKAVRSAQDHRYHVVLMDLQLPELDGAGALRAIRSLPGGSDLPVVALTAQVLGGERERCLAGGFDGYLSKPFEPHELFAAVEGWEIASDESGVDGRRMVPEGAGATPVDYQALTETMREAGVPGAVRSLLEVFAADAPMRMENLDLAIRSGVGEAIEANAHVYKSAAGTIRAAGLAALLHRIESAGRSGEEMAAMELLERVRREHESVMAFLHELEVTSECAAHR